MDKLEFAQTQINVMQAELQRLRPELIRTSAETGRLMTAIEHETIEVENAREVVAANEFASAFFEPPFSVVIF